VVDARSDEFPFHGGFNPTQSGLRATPVMDDLLRAAADDPT
jgi:hypothetical protein